jgi:RNA polymerase sigma-70 factor (ECF subfamily)
MAAAEARSLPPRGADEAVVADIQARHAEGRCTGAQDAYADIVRRHQRRALRIACRLLRDDADADEVVQDAFVKAYTHLSTFRPELAFQAWFTRILINSCLDRMKARRRRNRWLVPMPDSIAPDRDFLSGVAGSTASPEDQVLARERRQTLAGALARLTARQRSVVMLSHCDGLTSSEVTALTGWNPSTVRVQLFRGLRTLRLLLGEAQP